MKLLVDHNLPPLWANTINGLVSRSGHFACPLREKFEINTPDKIWLRQLGDEGGWSILTEDKRMLKNPEELIAFRIAKCRLFVLGSGWNKGLTEAKRLSLFLGRLDEIISLADSARLSPPVAFQIKLRGKIEQISI